MTTQSLPEWANAHPRELLERHGLRAQHRLGQNFLVGPSNLDRVVESANVEPWEIVLEIGTGMGRLTARLAARAGHVVTVEVDSATASAAAAHLADITNVTPLCCDFLANKHTINPLVTEAVAPLQAKTGLPVRVVANLPYSISSPAIVNMLEWDVPVGAMCLMVQKEVADRLVASPGTSDYGPLTIFAAYWAKAERLYNLGANTFWPAPKVASSLVQLVRTRTRDEARDHRMFVDVVRALMGSRRKTLRKALAGGWGKEAADDTIAALGMDPSTRPENLSVTDFERIAIELGPSGR